MSDHFGTPVTSVRKELEGRIEAIESEIEYNQKRIVLLDRDRVGHERQIEMLTELRAGYAAILTGAKGGGVETIVVPPEQLARIDAK